MEMETKQMALQINKIFNVLLEESIVFIQDLTIDYKYTLYVHCPNLKDYAKWVGICKHCSEDHPNQIKFVKLVNRMKAVQGSEQYVMIDIFNFTKVLITQLSSELNKFFNDCETRFQQLAQEILSVIEQIKKQADFIIIEQQKLYSLKKIFEESNLFISQDSTKIIVECNKKTRSWKGYCPQCRKNVKHQIHININHPSYLAKRKYIQSNLELELDRSSDYRLVDISQFKIKLLRYIEDQVFEIFFNKSQQILMIQAKVFKGFKMKYSQNQDTIVSLKQKIDSNIEQQEQYEVIQKKVKIDNQNVQNQLQDLNKIVKQFEEGSLYDIQINCANLTDLTTEQGWKVVKNELYEQQKDTNCSVVSFYGLYNKGKSFLASKLSGKIISSGYTISTIGLSALYPRDLTKENSIILLDTAGLETPINHHKKDTIYQLIQKQFEKEIDEVKHSKIYEAKLSDRLRTENLIQQFVLNQSHLILIIVDQLSKEEQKLIKRIKIKYQQSEIVIVHNFSKLTTLEEVKSYIETDIKNSFENINSQYRKMTNIISGDVYIESRWDDKGLQFSPITHVVMAKEYSIAGDLYNPFCYKYIENRMISINQFKKFDIITCLMAEVEKEIVNLFKLTTEQKKQQYQLQYDNKKNAITTNLPNAELKPISFDMLGVMQIYDEDETPKYNYQVTNERLILNVELNGRFNPQKEDQEDKFNKFICLCQNSGCSLLVYGEFSNGEQLIQLRAQYGGPHSQKLQQPDNTSDSKKQRLNRFQLIIPISPETCIIKSQPELSFELGIAKLQFPIQNRQQNLLEECSF